MSVRAQLEESVAGALVGPPRASLEKVLDLPAIRGLARSRTTAADLVELPDGTRCVRKHWRWPSATDRRKGLFRTTAVATSPAFRERAALLRLQTLPAGPFSPGPLAAWDRREHGVLHECVLLVTEVVGAVDLAHWLCDETDIAVRGAVLSDLAQRTAQMHAAGLLDGDFHPRNVLVEPLRRRCWAIDSPGQRAYRGAVPARSAWRDLAALDVGFRRLATASERVRFLRTYLGGAAPGAAVRRACAGVERFRARIDEREARRLPQR